MKFMPRQENYFKNILVVRTDRIGDVLLTTPVLKALRDNYPDSRIAIMVTPYTKEIVEGNPHINEVIVYDKDKYDKGIFGFLKFVLRLKRKRFDLAVVLHTKKRTNLITYLADIPRRIGYKNDKFGFLLTDRVIDRRKEGLKHEVDYCLDILESLGIKAGGRNLYMPLEKERLEWAYDLLQRLNIKKNDKIACINPGASCISKRWPEDRFIVLINKLIDLNSFKIIIIGGLKDIDIANNIAKSVRYPVVNLAGKTNLSELAALLKCSQILISNDSGPVHIATSVGTPVISIFGRNQAGLGPLRWGPLGNRDKYIHKKVGCRMCLAHNCKTGFECLKAITVDEVLKAVDDIINT